jgi:hypothetical protein
MFGLALGVPAHAESPGEAIADGDGARAAAALTASLTQALSRSRSRLQAPQIEALSAGLARDLSPIVSARRRPRVEIEISWRESVTPPHRQGPCSGFVDIGGARVTGTSTSRSVRAGMTQFSCSLLTQDERAYGWTSVWVASPGEGALYARMSASTEDPAMRIVASRSLQRALQRIAATVQPAAAGPPRRAPPRRAPPQPPQPPRQKQRPPPIEETI